VGWIGEISEFVFVWKPEDLKDLKIRIPENKIELATFKALSANPVNIPGSELFSALHQGVADGQDGSADWAYAKKLYDPDRPLPTSISTECGLSIRFLNNVVCRKLPTCFVSMLKNNTPLLM
jgi:hypothetical protein